MHLRESRRVGERKMIMMSTFIHAFATPVGIVAANEHTCDARTCSRAAHDGYPTENKWENITAGMQQKQEQQRETNRHTLPEQVLDEKDTSVSHESMNSLAMMPPHTDRGTASLIHNRRATKA